MTAMREHQAREVDGSGRLRITLRINGHQCELRARAHHTLLDVLRAELKLFGVREGCGVGMCGACTVLVNGKPVSSCLLLAPLADGAEVVTVEGLESADGELDPVQRSFVEHNAFQCSYCTPGFVIMTKALLAENARPTDDEIRSYLAGNICRCGSYVKIMDAVRGAKTGAEEGAAR